MFTWKQKLEIISGIIIIIILVLLGRPVVVAGRTGKLEFTTKWMAGGTGRAPARHRFSGQTDWQVRMFPNLSARKKVLWSTGGPFADVAAADGGGGGFGSSPEGDVHPRPRESILIFCSTKMIVVDNGKF